MLTTAATFNPDKAFGWIDLTARRSIVVAVSGGSDSTALLVSFCSWASIVHPGMTIVCVTVDHGLRSQSTGEARQVGQLCSRLGIAHRIMRWTGDKPATGLPAAAREARYELLAQAAREAGTDIVLTGHTEDDQAETVLMRFERGTGRGLAGMARATLFDAGIWILRPFLRQSREALRDVLRREGVEWIDDPTNFDTGYERVRVRQRLASDADKSELFDMVRSAARVRRDNAEAAANLIRDHAALAGPGLVRLKANLPDGGDVCADVWRVLLACCGGRPHPASRPDVERFIARLDEGRSCLSGTVAVKKREMVYLFRELRSGEPLQVRDGIFDGRYRIDRKAARNGWRLRARMPNDIHEAEQLFDAPESLVAAALAAEPVLDQKIPHSAAPKPEILRHLAPFDHFLPEFDLTLANAVATKFGRNCYPQPPCDAGKYPES